MLLSIADLTEGFPAGTNIISKHTLRPDQPSRRSDALQAGASICNYMELAPGDVAWHPASYRSAKHAVQSYICSSSSADRRPGGNLRTPSLKRCNR